MTTEQIESAANRGDLAAGDTNAKLLLRRQVIPEFLLDVGEVTWRKKTGTITLAVGGRDYVLPNDFLKLIDIRGPAASPGTVTSIKGRLKYIGEDANLVIQAEQNTTPGTPTGYYFIQRSASSQLGGTLNTVTSALVAGSGSLSFGQILDGASATLTISVPGAVAGAQVIPTWPTTLEAGLIGMMRVSATDTVEVRMFNFSGGPLTPTTQTFSYAVVQTVTTPDTGIAGVGEMKAIRFNIIPDTAATLAYVYLSGPIFQDDITAMDLNSVIPEPLQWGLVSGLRREIFFDRFGQKDPRYDRENVKYQGWVDKAKAFHDQARRNYFVSVR